MLAVPIDTTGGVTVGNPTVLWENDRWGLFSSYGVSTDGERFVVALTAGDPKPAEPIIVQNWTQELLERVPVN